MLWSMQSSFETLVSHSERVPKVVYLVSTLLVKFLLSSMQCSPRYKANCIQVCIHVNIGIYAVFAHFEPRTKIQSSCVYRFKDGRVKGTPSLPSPARVLAGIVAGVKMPARANRLSSVCRKSIIFASVCEKNTHAKQECRTKAIFGAKARRH